MLPRISVITSSYNQGHFIERTIKSVLNQNYSNIEHIIVDGNSNDNTLAILNKYPHLKVIREPDKGQADAINKGFAIATGDIVCFLNSDDTFAPGTLKRVAEEINPQNGRYIIQGRCRFIDENDQFTGVEHPSYSVNHARILKIWKGYAIPQPAVFWSRKVYEHCGGLNDQEHLVLDYDLFCRYSQYYQFHFIDQVFANYRLHLQSKTITATDSLRLEESIRASKRYWGAPYSFSSLKLTGSLLAYRFGRIKRARNYFSKAKSAWKNNKKLEAILNGFCGALLGPDILFYLYLYRWLQKTSLLKPINSMGYHQILLKKYPHIMSYLHFKDQWNDEWVGSQFIKSFELQKPANTINIIGQKILFPYPIELTVFINDIKISTYTISKSNFELDIKLPTALDSGVHQVKIIADKWFVLHFYRRDGDYRPLSWKMKAIGFS